MPSNNADRRTIARQAAMKRMRELGLTYTLIAEKVGDITRQTVSAFLRGEVDWPQEATLTKLDRALEWEPGTLAGIAMGTVPVPGSEPSDGPSRRALEIVWPDDLTPPEIAELEAAVRLTAAERARTIRASRHD